MCRTYGQSELQLGAVVIRWDQMSETRSDGAVPAGQVAKQQQRMKLGRIIHLLPRCLS